MLNPERKSALINIVRKVLNGKATAEERAFIEKYYDYFDEEDFEPGAFSPEEKARVEEKMLHRIYAKIDHEDKNDQRFLWRNKWIKVAATIAVLIVAGGYYLYNHSAFDGHKVSAVEVRSKDDIAPGGNRAALTLSNGQTIILDNAHTGQLVRQGATLVTKTDSGLLVYKNSKFPAGLEDQAASKPPGQTKYNTLTTPRGGQYRLALPDGTKVWLNSASSIRYPIAFTGKERSVYITGEAYMEVTEDAARPFIVQTRHSAITVLGTRFNVMAYDNEPAVRTTLLQGSVKVTVPGAKGAVAVLTPGQQASVGNASREIKIREVDGTAVASWIHGLLSLKDCSVEEFMNQLSRWYDVDIEYAGAVPQRQFGGLINRNAPLSDVLSALDIGGIHTELSGKKITVLSQ